MKTDLTFLTPGLFPGIQVFFNNAFQSEDDNTKIMLGNDSYPSVSQIRRSSSFSIKQNQTT